MFDRLRGVLLRVLRVPPEPAPPHGGRDARVFRASRRFYHYRLLRWALKQSSTVVGLACGFIALRSVPDALAGGLVARIAGTVEAAAVTGFLFQLLVSYAAVRLDFELRWYIVTDRSLRIREGLTRMREQTMTFANIQNISVRQGPLQRLLGIADVEVRSAGGGGQKAQAGGGKQHDMHVGLFRGVDNAQAIRAAVLDRIRRHRDAGLGDPDDERPDAYPLFEPMPIASERSPIAKTPGLVHAPDAVSAPPTLAARSAPRAGQGPAAAPAEPAPAADAESMASRLAVASSSTAAAAPDLLAAARDLASEARALRAALARAGA